MQTYVINLHEYQPKPGEIFKIVDNLEKQEQVFICVCDSIENGYLICDNCAFSPYKLDLYAYCHRFACRYCDREDEKSAIFVEITKDGFNPPFENWYYAGLPSGSTEDGKPVLKTLGNHKDAWAKVLQARQEEQKKDQKNEQ